MDTTPASANSRFLPITAYQADMVATSADPKTPDAYHLYFTLQWAFRIGTGLRPRALKTAFDKLVARHDSLRLRFAKHQELWVAEILDEHPAGLHVIDLSACSPDNRNKQIEDLAQTPIRAHVGPCFEMYLVRCGEEGDVLMIRAHHAIIDGYGLVILVEDLLKLLIRMPLLGAAVSHESFVTKIEAQTRTDEDKKLKFWLDQLLPLPEELNIGRHARGLPPFSPVLMDKTISLNNLFSEEESKALERKSASSGMSVFALIYVAFAEAICATADQDAAMICSWLGRYDAWTQNFVGCDNRMVQHIYRRSECSLETKAETVTKGIYDATMAQPSDVFLPGSPFMKVLEEQNRTLWRFQIHNALPSARLNNSPFGKFFWSGMKEKIDFGPIYIEKLSFPRACESRFELSVFIQQKPSGHNANLVADAAAFTEQELEELKGKMKDVLFD